MNENEYNKQIDEVLELYQGGKIQESISILSKIYKRIPVNDFISLGLAGSLFREANELSKALYCFQKEVKSHPMSPRASLGLFHTLWRLERYNEGFDELERFFLISESEEHLRLLEEDGEHFKLLEEMRQGFFEKNINKSDDPLSLIKKMRHCLSTEDTEHKSKNSH